MPGSSSQDLIHAALRDLIDGLKSFLQCPLTASFCKQGQQDLPLPLLRLRQIRCSTIC
jgi:hypothetical protein